MKRKGTDVFYALLVSHARNPSRNTIESVADGVYIHKTVQKVYVYARSCSRKTFQPWSENELAPVSMDEEFEFDGFYHFSDRKLAAMVNGRSPLRFDAMTEFLVLRVFDEASAPLAVKQHAFEVEEIRPCDLGVAVERFDEPDEEEQKELLQEANVRNEYISSLRLLLPIDMDREFNCTPLVHRKPTE